MSVFLNSGAVMGSLPALVAALEDIMATEEVRTYFSLRLSGEEEEEEEEEGASTARHCSALLCSALRRRLYFLGRVACCSFIVHCMKCQASRPGCHVCVCVCH